MKINFLDLPEPGERYEFGHILGSGVFGKVYIASDKQASNKKVAIKLQKYEDDRREYVEEEYKILRDCSNHLNIIDFYGIYKQGNEIWLVLEPCEGGTAVDLVTKLLAKNRRMAEEHISYILKEVIRAIIYLHGNNVIHRDIKGNNILLTKEGEVKLCDFGLSKRKIKNGLVNCIGSPCWMAPEVAENNYDPELKYDSRVDVWSIGITAIELAEGKAPYEEMHPTRALFQIIRNPPPVLKKLSHWSQDFHDFINETLVKNFEHRPYIEELIEHPLLEQVPENNFHLSLEIKSLLKEVEKTNDVKRLPEVNVIGRFLKKSIDDCMEAMYEEDVAALQKINEKEILYVLERHFERGQCYSFIGDVLLFLNPNEKMNIFGDESHHKYFMRSRSNNAPHIYSVADVAVQDAFHHSLPQQIVLFGETGSGKTTNYFHLIDHLFFLGENASINLNRIKNSIKLLHSMIHASTPWNCGSTRAVFRTEVSYGNSRKVSGAAFKINCLEKWRISSADMLQSSFNIIYYIRDGLVSRGLGKTYKIEPERNYRFLRLSEDRNSNQSLMKIKRNIEKFKRLSNIMEDLEFTEDQIAVVYSVVAAILNLGEINFRENDDMSASIENKEFVENVADLLEVDQKKILWALTNYCVIKEGKAIRKRNSCYEAKDARNVLANTLYSRLVDYLINEVNAKLAVGKQIFGAKYSVKVLDYFGFECFKRNNYFQLLVNCFNEQMHYHYLQRIFAWEMVDLQNEEIEFTPIHYYNNKDTLNELLGKPEGVFSMIDDASKKGLTGRYITENLYSQDKFRVHIQEKSQFSVAHYTGRVTYEGKNMPEKNRDFLPAEIIETLRGSGNSIISSLFSNKLNRNGNLMSDEETKSTKFRFMSKINKTKQYSQIKKMRTQASVFRAFCIDLLKELSIGSGMGGTHFVKCIRTDLKNRPKFFQKELVKQQMRAMAITETAVLRKNGYSQRIPFHEFLRRYKFLAFDFDENVDLTGDNCRLLMVRLNMEGWTIGKTKIFLKYYNEEYLSRLYETQVRKIVKVQSLLRGFLAKCKMAKRCKKQEEECIKEINKQRRASFMTEEEAAEIIQKAYRRTNKRKETLETFPPLKDDEVIFIKPFVARWKNNSFFSVLMRYRGLKLQDFFNFSQQVHLYNMKAFHNLQSIGENVYPEVVESKATVSTWLGPTKASVFKVLFRLDDIPYYDVSNIQDYFSNVGNISDRESWDTPYRWRDAKEESRDSDFEKYSEDDLVNLEYQRDPEEPMLELPETDKFEEKHLIEEKKYSKSFSVDGTTMYSQSASHTSLAHRDNCVQKSFESVPLRKVKTPEPMKTEIGTINRSTSPANKDFEYIKAKPVVNVKPRYPIDPIAELKNMPRKESTASDDDPPFNFQAMLRKTNIRRDSRDSIRNALQAVRRFSLTNSNNGLLEEEHINANFVSMEISPGVFIEGQEVEL